MRIITLSITFALVVGCGSPATPTPTGATCPDPSNPQFTWQNFGSDFFCHYCTNCHDSSLKLDQRNGAPLFHDLDSLLGVMEVAVHTDEQAAWGPKAHNDFMPGAGTDGRCPSMMGGSLDEDCPMPTDQERKNLGVFLACEKQRPQDYQGSAGSFTDHCAMYTGPH
jgi:hypothetical protein